MKRLDLLVPALAIGALACLAPSWAYAAEGEDPPAAAASDDASTAGDAGEAPTADGASGDQGKGDEGQEREVKTTVTETSSSDTLEDPSKSYYFINARFRDVILPKFMLNIFADGGRTVNVPMIGLELTRRKDNMEMDIAVSYADYSMDPFLFKGKSDGPEAYENVDSSLKAVYVTMDLLYDIPIDKHGKFSFLIGGGIGLGGVFGDLNRRQVTPTGTSIDPDNPSTARDCRPDEKGTNVYCDDSNDHYGSYTEPSWANGGSLPFVMPWISLPQVSLRIKPIKELQIRVDGGFSITGFFAGASVGYGIPVSSGSSSKPSESN